jgi:hypothetical protein
MQALFEQWPSDGVIQPKQKGEAIGAVGDGFFHDTLPDCGRG